MANISLDAIWEQQKLYNEKVKHLHRRSESEWIMDYILGTMRELGELLEQIKWKVHRETKMKELGPNVDEEMADVTKYVFSMWQLLGKKPEDMLNALHIKGEILDQLFRQEMRDELEGKSIIMLDLDGCVADFRQGFMDWVKSSPWADILKEGSDNIGLHLDLNNGWDFHSYNQAKRQFETEGGYRLLPANKEMVGYLKQMKRLNRYIIIYTARPYSQYRRVWKDTFSWLYENEVPFDELHFGYDDRVAVAKELSFMNEVSAIEDDPLLIRRYISSMIYVTVVPQPYNEGITKYPSSSFACHLWDPEEARAWLDQKESTHGQAERVS